MHRVTGHHQILTGHIQNTYKCIRDAQVPNKIDEHHTILFVVSACWKDCCVALPHDATGLSAVKVSDCGIS